MVAAGIANHGIVMNPRRVDRVVAPDLTVQQTFENTQFGRARTEQSFLVPKADIVAQDYDLSLNRYKEVVHEEVAHKAPKVILAELRKLEKEIEEGIRELEGMLGGPS